MLTGFMINLQFFTVIPVKKELQMDSRHLHRAIQTFPLTGLMTGLVLSGALWIFNEWLPFSVLAAAFFVWLLTIVLSGGLHLDGWMDASDAFFSYQDRDRRLEIMKDPRTGAFGVLSVIVLLSGRFLFIYEIAAAESRLSYALIPLVPVLGKMAMGVSLAALPLARQNGLAAFFKKACKTSSTGVYPVYLLIILGIAFLLSIQVFWCAVLMVAAGLLTFLYAGRKVKSWFGGITGDVLGAITEGTECCLWLVLWLLHCFVMG